ncbi:PaaI family thioesterase [Pendulispora brunnea]|uniref:Acyl-coenzyme A thioesterase THEM4 n=1 Tax=Pendulispora brunnea TaxID=2905690 RepID=A0ABZ2K8U5_9BACT
MPSFNPEPLDPNTFGESQPCFGCSPNHPIGFRLRFSKLGDDTVTTTFLPGEVHQGPPGIMHGGLVTTLADEIAAWAVIGCLGKFGFTANLQGKFSNPVRIGVPIEGVGRIARNGNRVIVVDVELAQGGLKPYTGQFTFAVLDKAGTERLLQRPLPEGWEKFGR